jgi:GNAT superfamily N-acetyltransferase
MTGNQEYIHRDQQIKWFKELDHEELRLFLFWADFELSGYGIVRRKDGNPWLTGVLCEHQRGKGYGKKLFQLLIDLCEDDLTPELDVRETNIKARTLYTSLGFQETVNNNGIISMVLRR